jgi:SAM-dependent methyltransferase
MKQSIPLLKIWRLATSPKSFSNALFRTVVSQPSLREILYRYIDWRDQRSIKPTIDRVPPASLRFRVHGDVNVHSFLETGRQCRQDIKDALARVSKDIGSFRNILDFGCGCGRTITWFPRRTSAVQLHGTDIDAAAIEWCRRHLDFASFEVNEPLPPLCYPPNSFDLVYAISVFTHLNEDYQFRWLAELQRITKPKGYVLLTLRGSYYSNGMDAAAIEELRKTGFMFREEAKFMQGIFPKWYQDAYHTQEYVRCRYSDYFKVLEYLPSGLDACQDMVVLQKA